jgi:hypothetical protein
MEEVANIFSKTDLGKKKPLAREKIERNEVLENQIRNYKAT